MSRNCLSAPGEIEETKAILRVPSCEGSLDVTLAMPFAPVWSSFSELLLMMLPDGTNCTECVRLSSIAKHLRYYVTEKMLRMRCKTAGLPPMQIEHLFRAVHHSRHG